MRGYAHPNTPMHTLHTTDAFVLAHYARGEVSRVYKLFTRERGLLYAHGQGVRDIRNRNRYALSTGAHAVVTLVRGREVWRITGARQPECSYAYERSYEARRILALLAKLLPIEDHAPAVFDVMHEGLAACAAEPPHAPDAELVTVLRLLNELGYVPRPVHDPIVTTYLTSLPCREVLASVRRDRAALVEVVNSALRATR